MRIIFLGDRMWGYSAYGKVINNLCMRLKDEHTLAHIPMSHAIKGGYFNYQGVLLYPSGASPFGEDVAPSQYAEFNADMLITVKEPWVFQSLHQWALNLVPMAIIDHSPVSGHITYRLHSAFKVIAISRHGQRELKDKKIDSTYIPHGVPVNIYRPLERKEECRKLHYFGEGDYAIGIVAMNRGRKMLPHMIRGISLFREANPDIKFRVMMWTDIRPSLTPEEIDPSMGIADIGVDLLPEILQLDLNEVIMWPEQKLIRRGIPEWSGEDYVTGWDMVKLYNSFDVLLHCTGGEGFGLPLIEAQACGVPVITTDYAAGPEQVGAGLTVPPSDYVILNTPGTRYAIPDAHKMAEALAKISNMDGEKLKRRARRSVQRYDWDNVVHQHMKPFLDECESELFPLVTKEGLKRWQ